jgi:3-methyladenine DNA glycosylase Tag
MKFSEYITEDKPIGNKNKELWFDYLKDNFSKDPKDLYVTFVSEDKVGINPKSRWNTPNGVYTYPLEWVLEGNKIPFRGSSPKKIKVLKSISDKVLNDKFSEKDLEKTLEKLKPVVESLLKTNETFLSRYEDFSNFIKDVIEESNNKSPFGKIWNITRKLSENPNKWSKLLIDLGFDFVVDDGHGIIHDNEPTQAVFLNPKSYKVIGEEFIDTENRYITTNKVFDVKSLKELLEKSTPEAVGNFLLNNKELIMKLSENKIIDTFKVLVSAIFGRLYNSGAGAKVIDKVLNLYKSFFIKFYKVVGITDFDSLYFVPKDAVLSFIEYYHDIFKEKIFKSFLKEDYKIFEFIGSEDFYDYFNDVIKELLKAYELGFMKELLKTTNYKILYANESLFKKIYEHDPDLITVDYIKSQIEKKLEESYNLLESEFTLSEIDPESIYKVFKDSYDKSTGMSWDYNKFIQRSANWKFFGNTEGFVTVRVQKSGFWKITSCAGNPKGILKGLEELVSKNVPLWTAATGELSEMLKKKGFIVFKGMLYGFAIKKFVEGIDKSVFGDDIEKVESDGGIIFNIDGKKFKKYFCCNKEYLKSALKSDKVPETVKKILGAFL